MIILPQLICKGYFYKSLGRVHEFFKHMKAAKAYVNRMPMPEFSW